MCDNIWAYIEVSNNVHPRLWGLHTIMNSSGSVGNIWWCRQNAIPELIKHCKTKLLLPLHEVLCQCWQEGAVPQCMRDSTIITIYKNRGERDDCNNYRGISLRSIVGKVYARVILIRLQKLAERIYPESQCDILAELSTLDMIVSLRQLQVKCREQHMPLYIDVIDLTKAFDLVSRDGLFKVLQKIGYQSKLQCTDCRCTLLNTWGSKLVITHDLVNLTYVNLNDILLWLQTVFIHHNNFWTIAITIIVQHKRFLFSALLR